MRTALTVGTLAVALLALAGCSAGTVQNAAATSSTSSPATTTSAPARAHEVRYMFTATGANGNVDAPFTYVKDDGSVANETTGGVLLIREAHLPEGRIAMVAVGAAPGMLYSSCSIDQDGKAVVEQRSQDPKAPATCSYIVQ